MIERMKDADEALRREYRKKELPYFSIRLGERSRHIIRIGNWKEEFCEYDKEAGMTVRKTIRHSVTPAKMYNLWQSYRKEKHLTEIHLWLDPLPRDEQIKWVATFQDVPNVTIDGGDE